MEFNYKNADEIKTMTAEEQEAYVKEMKAYEAKQAEKKAQELVEAAKSELKKTINEKSEEKADTELVNALKEQLEEATKELNEIKDKQSNLDKSFDDLKTENKTKGTMSTLGAKIIDKLDNAIKSAEGNRNQLNGLQFTLKDDAADTHTISDVPGSVYPAGSTTNVSDEFLQNYGQRVGLPFGTPIRKNRFLDYVDTFSLTGNYLLRDVLFNQQGQAEFVPECGIKPIVKEDVKTENAKAGKIALRYRVSEEWQKFIPTFVQERIMERYNERLMLAVTNAVFGNDPNFTENATANAAAYTPSVSHQIFTEPNHLDAIGAAVNSLELRDYTPNVIMMNPSEKMAVFNAKGTDGHYSVFNNGSIQLVNGQLFYVNGGTYPIVFDKTIPEGSLFIGSMDTLQIGIDDEVILRTGYDQNGDLSRNILTIVLEKFVAVSAPAEVGDGMLYDTFDNIKTAITA